MGSSDVRMDQYLIIRNAILERRNISATYDGHHRVLSPHVLGTKHGEVRLVAYQLSEESLKASIFPGSDRCWVCLSLDRLEDVQPALGQWLSAPDEAHPGDCVDIVDLEAGRG